VLSAERYGVPQTRKRAFLIASLDGPVELPAATHRSYQPRRKEMPEEELALEPWVSMAEALGWGMTARPGLTVVADHKNGGTGASECITRQPRSGKWAERDRRPGCNPAPTLTARTRSWTRQPCVQIRRSGKRITEGFDPADAPAQAITSRVNRWQAYDIHTEAGSPSRAGAGRTAERPAPTLVTTRRSRDGASIRGSEQPAPTVHFGQPASKVKWVPCAYETRQRGAQPRPVEQPAPTMLAAGLAKGTPVWAGRRPATTIACDRRVHPPGHKQNASDPAGRYQQRRGVNAVRVTVEQAAVLQGFPVDYPWQGVRTRQFTQVGNAVPPPLAQRVIEQAIAAYHGRSGPSR
jgi:DNA (cytosine-5)-methyltransferase 1